MRWWWVVGGVAAAGVAVVWNLRPIVLWAMVPSGTFADSAVPVAPDYADAASWSALPDRIDADDTLPVGLVPADPARADVFYVHPTSYLGPAWNGPVDDPSLNAATDRVATGIQAAAWRGCCAVWAPRYRQATGGVFTEPSADGNRALDLAYDDVRRAFLGFLERRGAGRPFVLAGHSQGSLLAARLLEEEIVGRPLQELLVVAVLPGAPVTTAWIAEVGLRACETPDEVGCVITYNARGPSYTPSLFDLRTFDDRPRACVNPLTGRADEEHAPASANVGAVFLEDDDRTLRAGFADAQCDDGVLVVRSLRPMPRDLPSRILDRVMGPENYHPVEVQLFFGNLWQDAVRRLAAWDQHREDARGAAAP